LTLLPGLYGIGTPASNVVTINDYVFTPDVIETTSAGDWDSAGIWSLNRSATHRDRCDSQACVTLNHTTDYLSSLTITNAHSDLFQDGPLNAKRHVHDRSRVALW